MRRRRSGTRVPSRSPWSPTSRPAPRPPRSRWLRRHRCEPARRRTAVLGGRRVRRQPGPDACARRRGRAAARGRRRRRPIQHRCARHPRRRGRLRARHPTPGPPRRPRPDPRPRGRRHRGPDDRRGHPARPLHLRAAQGDPGGHSCRVHRPGCRRCRPDRREPRGQARPAPGRRRDARPRPRQHPARPPHRRRHGRGRGALGAGRASRSRCSTRRRSRARLRRPARRQRGQRRGAAHDQAHLPPDGGPAHRAPHAGRQGHHVRLGRDQPQAGRRHPRHDEERHVGRRGRARRDVGAGATSAAGPPSPAT